MGNGSENYRRYLDGDDKGLVELIREYKDELIMFINSFVRNVSTAEDICQDVFVKLAIKKPAYNGKASFKTWLYTIGRNMAIDRLRKDAAHPTENIDDYQLAADEVELLESVIKEEEKQNLHIAMKKIKPEYAEVLSLRYFDEMEVEEIAKVVGKKKHAVEMMLTRGREALRNTMVTN